MQYGYYVTKLSENIGQTPEGFLVCRSVPLARVGWQEYLGSEISPKDYNIANTKMRVYRSEKEVFNPVAMTSFEGKTVTDGHPSDWVVPDNESIYHRGHVQNIRRGDGEFKDCLMGDLIIKEANLINKVQNGLREISCGYYCIYQPVGNQKDTFIQTNIRGNHVAVVPDGRAGDWIAIRDSAENLIAASQHKQEKRISKMPITWKTLIGLGLKEFAKDAEPDAVAEAAEMAKNSHEVMQGKGKDAFGMQEEKPKPEEAKPAAQGGGSGDKDDRILSALEKMLSLLEPIASKLSALEAPVAGAAAPAAAKEPEPEEQLDEFASSFEPEKKKDENESLHAAGEAAFHDAEPTMSGQDLPENPIPGADAKSMVKDTIAAMKPFIAAIANKVERQKAVDALIGTLKKHTTPSAQSYISYSDLLASHMKSAKMAADAKVAEKQATNPADDEIGEKIREKFHRKAVIQ